MGPYSEEQQQRRANSIASLLLMNKNKDVNRIWEKHMRNLARTENDYNARVIQVYSGDWK